MPTAAPDVGPQTVLEFARRAEAARVDSIWSLDRLVFDNYEPLVSLSAAAGATEHVRIGTSVLLGTLRPPVLLAKMIATLDQITGGRVILGMGVGRRTDDFEAAGVPFERRGGRLEELVQLLKLTWSGEPVRHQGRFYQIDVGPVGPAPRQRPHPPIWLGGSAEPALQRVARIANGYIAGSSGGPQGFRATWDKVRGYAEAAGRDPLEITPAALVYACVDDDRGHALELAQRYLNRYYGGGRASDGTGLIIGPPDDCVRAANAYLQGGVKHLIVGSVTAEVRYLERLCEQVLPRLETG